MKFWVLRCIRWNGIGEDKKVITGDGCELGGDGWSLLDF
jgi:hypothetical protein